MTKRTKYIVLLYTVFAIAGLILGTSLATKKGEKPIPFEDGIGSVPQKSESPSNAPSILETFVRQSPSFSETTSIPTIIPYPSIIPYPTEFEESVSPSHTEIEVTEYPSYTLVPLPSSSIAVSESPSQIVASPVEPIPSVSTERIE